jgi:precorrin-6B methylase 2
MSNAYQSPLKRWDVIAGLLADSGCDHLVDVGCGDGRLAGALLGNLPKLKIVAIPNTVMTPQMQKKFAENIDTNEHRVEFVERLSTRDLQNMPGDLDCVYLEGQEPDQVARQIADWLPKIKAGGMLLIGNYKHQEGIPVMRAVADAFPLYRVAVFPDHVAMVTV